MMMMKWVSVYGTHTASILIGDWLNGFRITFTTFETGSLERKILQELHLVGPEDRLLKTAKKYDGSY